MGNTPSVVEHIPLTKKCFIIDRLVAAECDFIPEAVEAVIRVGVFTDNEDKANPLHQQGIRIGSDKIYPLKSFKEHNNGLEYEFGNNISLNVFKRESGVCYRLKTAELDVTREINPAVLKYFKTIDMGKASEEIDKLSKIMR